MKKYFVKYLPVEGEVNDGDIIAVNGEDGNNIYIKYKEAPELLGSSVKYKLFLCSRDVKIGEKFYSSELHNLKMQMPVSSINNDFIYNGSAFRFNRKSCYKILGPISVDAIWIKEGDEFDEEDWQAVTPNKMIDYEKQNLGSCDKYIKIKGPCGHFH